MFILGKFGKSFIINTDLVVKIQDLFSNKTHIFKIFLKKLLKKEVKNANSSNICKIF